MESEETQDVNVLETVDGTFVDSVENSVDIPEMTEEEADDREYEQVEVVEEGGL